jgi:2-isopropylmalate synthase
MRDESARESRWTYQRFLAVADKKLEVFDADLVAIMHDELHPAARSLAARILAGVQRHLGHPDRPLRLLVHGEQRQGAALAGDPARLVRYDIHAVTSGTEAMGEVTVQLEKGERRVLGRGASTDVIETSAKAYLDGLNRLANVG